MQPTVVIYSSPGCAYCHDAAEFLKERQIDFVEKDITTDQEALKYVLEEVGQAVTPIITVNDEVIIGFDRQKLENAIKNSRKGE
ncbi:MAG: glutaredoxin family protein [Candidatus Woesebacteria bacterium]|jgi:glutaredoxin-like YruB-family protein